MSGITMGSVTRRQQFIDIFSDRLAFLEEILGNNYDAPSLTYSQVFNVRDSARAYEEITSIHGFGQFSKKPEGEKIDYDRMIQGFDKRFKHDTWAKGASITFEAMSDDVDGALSDVIPALARVARNSIETDAYGDFNNGFGATVTTPDGANLFSATHLLEGGGTFSNLVAADFSQGALETALNIFDDFRDGRNQLIEGDAAILLHPIELRWRIHEVLKSQLRSDTANNTTNALSQIGISTLMSKYLTDADSWFLLSKPANHRLLYYWREEPMSDSTLDFDTGNWKTKMTYRMSHGAANWRNLVGGQGQ